MGKKVFILFMICISLYSVVCAEELAVVVHKSNPVNELSLHDLRSIMKGAKQFWEHGPKIYLVYRESNSDEQQMVLQYIYKMSKTELRNYWVARIFKGEVVSFPKIVYSSRTVKKFVSKIPNAIAILFHKDADKSVKVLKIEGKLPGEQGYPLSESKRDKR